MKYYLIAGEASGDLHGSNLMKGILKADPGARFRFWGGDKMAAVGGAENLAMHYEKASFMGFTEVLKNLRTIFGQIEQCKRDVAAYAPDVLVLIDYAGFNLRLARFGRAESLGMEGVAREKNPALGRPAVRHLSVRGRVFPSPGYRGDL